MKIRDRIKSLRRVKASDLAPNPRNWREHPQAQVDAMRALLTQIGFAGASLAYETPDGLRLIDGHMRASLADDEKIPVLVLDISEAEASMLIATYDPIGAAAETNGQQLAELISDIETQDASIKALLESLAEKSGVFEDDEPHPKSEDMKEDSEKLQEFIARRKESSARGADKGEVNFWVCLVFQSWLQKQDFLRQIQDVPVLYGMYADGVTFADRVGMPVISTEQKPFESPLDKKLKALALSQELADSE